jgi:DNA-binding NarL/FixJ family response regulator
MDGRALVDAASRLQPEVIVLDISLPLLNGIDAARQIKKELPETKIVFLTMHANAEYLREALAAGASGYVLKTSASEELPGEEIVEQFERQPRSVIHSHSVLTARQREILQLVAEGRTAKEIAGILNVSLQTVAFHKYQMMNKLGIRTTAELTKYAIQQGLVVP